ncbi:hypothetical protein B0H19DRAFT_1180287 [Mycena capillaripes]|nr:hypothetical protein B0H19DRAFT_1180287 [Mycena capillaripes]
MEEKVKVFLKWLDLWRGALIAWGAFSADLANQLPGYLLTHSYLVEVDRRSLHEAAKHSARSKFTVLRGEMRTDDQAVEEFNLLLDLEYRAQVIEKFKLVSPAPGKLRIVVACYPGPLYYHGGDFLGNIFPDGKAATFANPLSPDSRLVSSALVRAWAEQFAEHVRSGNVTGQAQVLDTVIQDGQVLRQAALEVD